MIRKLLIIDDHEIFSNGLKMILEDKLKVEVLHSFSSGRDAFNFLRSYGEVDLVILDLNMPEMDGFKFLENIKKARPQQKILVVSLHHLSTHIKKCNELGADGFIQKDASLERLLEASQTVMKGKKFFFEPTTNDPLKLSDGFKTIFKLSPTEIKIITLFLDQKNNREVSEIMNLSYLTVKTHRKNIYRKMDVHNISGIISKWKEMMDNTFRFY